MSPMFIEYALKDPQFYFMVVITVIVSVVLHELAHGIVAIWQGDDTPIHTGHMTLNPYVHMGWMSLIMAFVFGLAWGAMPVNPSRFRSRYGDAMVSFAGPLTNLLIALITASVYGFLIRRGIDSENQTMRSVQMFLGIAAVYNIALAIFNLLPVPPLDGSSVLANFSYGYSRWLQENAHATPMMMVGLFVVVGFLNKTPFGLFPIAHRVLGWYTAIWLR